MAVDVDFDVLGELREPPARSREGRYAEVHRALAKAKQADGRWVALVEGDKKTCAAVRNAITQEFQSDLGWRSGIHPSDADGDLYTLFVKYDPSDPRPARKNRKAEAATAAPVAEPVAEPEPEAGAEADDDDWDEPAQPEA